MATTSYGVNHALAVKVWAKKLFVEALKQTRYEQFKGKSGTDSLITLKNDLSKGAGDRIRVGLRMQLTGAGVSGDDTLEGNEEALTTYSDDLFIDQLRHAEIMAPSAAMC
jgi:N4-gp56 family major capsid protein